MQNDLKNIIESLLFVSDNPVDVRTLKQVIPDADAKDIRLAIAELAGEYEDRQGGFMLYEVAGGFQFRTRPGYKDWIKKLVKPSPVRLSKAALETLAIIAYHQPIIRADVERIRGVDSGAILRTLLERKLVRILGKKEIPGRPLIYATTRRFLEIFNLKSLSDMPSLKEIQEFGQAGMAEQFAAGTGIEVVQGEEGVSTEEGAESSGQDASAFTGLAPATQGTEEDVYPDQDGDESESDTAPDEGITEEAAAEAQDEDIAEDEAASGVPDESITAAGAEDPFEAEEAGASEPGMDSPEYDETESPDMEEEEHAPGQDKPLPETDEPGFQDQSMDGPPAEETQEEPPAPEDQGGL